MRLFFESLFHSDLLYLLKRSLWWEDAPSHNGVPNDGMLNLPSLTIWLLHLKSLLQQNQHAWIFHTHTCPYQCSEVWWVCQFCCHLQRKSTLWLRSLKLLLAYSELLSIGNSLQWVLMMNLFYIRRRRHPLTLIQPQRNIRKYVILLSSFESHLQ